MRTLKPYYTKLTCDAKSVCVSITHVSQCVSEKRTFECIFSSVFVFTVCVPPLNTPLCHQGSVYMCA